MREIEFRAWNVVSKMMIDLKKITPLALNMDTDGLFIPFSDGLILMQYTGLKDKNGVKIFEGDVLDWREGECGKFHRKIVTFNSDNAAFSLTPYYPFNVNIKFQGEVIGNIYENPELLTPE